VRAPRPKPSTSIRRVETFSTVASSNLVEFHILLALAAEERHGYGLLQEVARLTDGELQLEPGTLYRALHRMLKDGWVAESARRPAADQDDQRRRYYRLTPMGRRVASAEADRLLRLVTVARAHRLISRA
jgi:DNA-binding PadR family transcriptional regulator